MYPTYSPYHTETTFKMVHNALFAGDFSFLVPWVSESLRFFGLSDTSCNCKPILFLAMFTVVIVVVAVVLLKIKHFRRFFRSLSCKLNPYFATNLNGKKVSTPNNWTIFILVRCFEKAVGRYQFARGPSLRSVLRNSDRLDSQ